MPLAHRGARSADVQDARQERDVPRSAEGLYTRRGQGEVDATIEVVVAGLRLVPRVGPAGGWGAPGHGVTHRAAVGPGPARRRLDHHDPEVALGTEGQELLGRLAVLGPGPQRRIDREHHRVEIETSERLEVGPGHRHVVTGDPREAGVARVAERQDAFERGRTPVELRQGGHRMRLVEVEHIGIEQATGRVELVGDAVGIGPQGLAGDEQLLAVGRQVRTHHRLGCAVCGAMSRWFTPRSRAEPQPRAGFLDAWPPSRRHRPSTATLLS